MFEILSLKNRQSLRRVNVQSNHANVAASPNFNLELLTVQGMLLIRDIKTLCSSST